MHRDTGEPVVVGRVEAMSKSKRNTVDPEAIIARYGADTARWFILSDNPPERDMEWTEAGVAGAFRFTQRVFRLVETLGDAPCRSADRCRRMRLRRVTHRTIAAVSEALDSFAFNVAVARLYELANAIAERAEMRRACVATRREAMETLARLVAPMMPHLAEEVYATAASRLPRRWSPTCPGRRPIPLCWRRRRVTIAVQVMGKLRGTIAVPAGCAARCQYRRGRGGAERRRALQGKRIVKEIYVPDRIINFVVAADAPAARCSLLAAGADRCPAAGSSRSTCRPPRARPAWRSAELAAIQVDIIPDRPGQLLRQALQERLEMGAKRRRAAL